jgi:hypothetical protein
MRLPMAVVPWGQKGGCDRLVLARFDLAVAVLLRIARLSVAAGRDQLKHPGCPRRAERRTEYAIGLGKLTRGR